MQNNVWKNCNETGTNGTFAVIFLSIDPKMTADTWDVCRNLVPLDSSLSPGLVTSLFYRIGRPRSAPAYTSPRTAAWVFSPSSWNKTGRPFKGSRSTNTGKFGKSSRSPAAVCCIPPAVSEWGWAAVKESLRNFILSRQPMNAAQCASRKRRAVHDSSSSKGVGGAGYSEPRLDYEYPAI